MTDPVFRKLVYLHRAEKGMEKTAERWCTQCHSPIGTRSLDIIPGFDFDELSSMTLEGVTCDGCHKVAEIARTQGSGHIIKADLPLQGPLKDPKAPHETGYSEIYEQAEFCAACHDVFMENDVHKLQLESPYKEWLSSPAAADGRTCQSCHMGEYTGKAANVEGSPERTNLHRHTFTGVDVPLMKSTSEATVRAELLLASQRKLRESKHVALQIEPDPEQPNGLIAAVLVDNLADGHDFPTGSSFFRQAWLAIDVHDSEGNLIYQSGQMDEDGNVYDILHPEGRDKDPDLKTFGKYLFTAEGEPTLFPWRAVKLDGTTLLAGQQRWEEYKFTVPETAVYPLKAHVELRFRPFTPRLLHELGLDELLGEFTWHSIGEADLTLDEP